MKFETLAIHAGQQPDPNNGAVMTPIYQTSTYKQDGVGKPRQGYEYSRTKNPTRLALEESGDHVLAGNDVYGGTYRLFDKVFRPFGLDFNFVDTTDPENVAEALTPQTRLVWLETPTNPLLSVTDLRAVAEAVHAHPAHPLLAVDNTFATPYNQRPLDLGADLVVHSTTKYLGGHSDVVGGAVIVKEPALFEKLAYLQNAAGAVPGPMDCFLVLRGIKTLPVRMERHAQNAVRIADYLVAHPKVASVLYPFHASHPQYGIARNQMKSGGGMVSFVMQAGAAAAVKVAEHTQLFTLAESLGGVESLIEVPAAMTHLSTQGSPMEVDPGLVRLSVGLENIEDLLEDLEGALAQA
jgi:cystathionine beta-lyase/cystathionine gamma-synthase